MVRGMCQSSWCLNCFLQIAKHFSEPKEPKQEVKAGYRGLQNTGNIIGKCEKPLCSTCLLSSSMLEYSQCLFKINHVSKESVSSMWEAYFGKDLKKRNMVSKLFVFFVLCQFSSQTKAHNTLNGKKKVICPCLSSTGFQIHSTVYFPTPCKWRDPCGHDLKAASHIEGFGSHQPFHLPVKFILEWPLLSG